MIKCDALAQNGKDKHSATNGTRRSYNRDDAPRSRLPVVTDSEINPESRLRLFEELIIPHLDVAHNLARWLTRNEQDACDVVQGRTCAPFASLTVTRAEMGSTGCSKLCAIRVLRGSAAKSGICR